MWIKGNLDFRQIDNKKTRNKWKQFGKYKIFLIKRMKYTFHVAHANTLSTKIFLIRKMKHI